MENITRAPGTVYVLLRNPRCGWVTRWPCEGSRRRRRGRRHGGKRGAGVTIFKRVWKRTDKKHKKERGERIKFFRRCYYVPAENNAERRV